MPEIDSFLATYTSRQQLLRSSTTSRKSTKNLFFSLGLQKLVISSTARVTLVQESPLQWLKQGPRIILQNHQTNPCSAFIKSMILNWSNCDIFFLNLNFSSKFFFLNNSHPWTQDSWVFLGRALSSVTTHHEGIFRETICAIDLYSSPSKGFAMINVFHYTRRTVGRPQ